MKRKAIFPGTFDPFTLGHKSLVDRSLQIVDELIIAVGINDKKETYFTLEERMNFIRFLYKKDERVLVKSYNSLTVDFVKQENANFIIRGIRTINDFEYERSIADVNRELEAVDTIVLFTEPRYAHISSTIVRELLKFDRDVSKFLPNEFNFDEFKKTK